MNNSALITVVVPIYKVEKYLERCIESIIIQTYNNLEIILVDDGSPDKCGEICEQYKKRDSRIKVIHQENKGLSEARNAGLSIATGKYIIFIDSDDYIDKNMILILYTNLINHNAQISCCGHTDIYEGSNNIVKSNERNVTVMDAETALGVFLFTKVIDVVAWNKLYDICLFADVRYMPNKLFEDHFTTYKLIEQASQIVNTTEPLYYYCKRSTSIGGESFSEKNYQLKEALDIECNYIMEKYPKIKKKISLAYIVWMFVLYDKMLLADSVDNFFLKELRKNIRGNFINILLSNDISLSKKAQLILLYSNKKIYEKVYRWYIKRYR